MDVAEDHSLDSVAQESTERVFERGLESFPGRAALDERHIDGGGLSGDELDASRVKADAPGRVVEEVDETGDLETRAPRAIRGESAVLSTRPHDRAARHGIGKTTGRPSCRPTARPGPNTSEMSSELSTVSAFASRTTRPPASTTSRVAMAPARFRSCRTAATARPRAHASSRTSFSIATW